MYDALRECKIHLMNLARLDWSETLPLQNTALTITSNQIPCLMLDHRLMAVNLIAIAQMATPDTDRTLYDCKDISRFDRPANRYADVYCNSLGNSVRHAGAGSNAERMACCAVHPENLKCWRTGNIAGTYNLQIEYDCYVIVLPVVCQDVQQDQLGEANLNIKHAVNARPICDVKQHASILPARTSN